MKRLISAICFCLFLTILGLIILLPESEAQENVLQNLLDLPAPPPPNPLVEKNKRRGRVLVSNQPDDDASIEELTAYWGTQGLLNPIYSYIKKPSEKSLDRIFEEVEKDPESLMRYLEILPRTQKYRDLVKRYYDQELSDQKYRTYWRNGIKKWLTYNSDFYSG